MVKYAFYVPVLYKSMSNTFLSQEINYLLFIVKLQKTTMSQFRGYTALGHTQNKSNSYNQQNV